MLEKYGFLCDCQACTLTGDQRRRNNDERQLVVTLDKHIERHLYDFESEHNDNTLYEKERYFFFLNLMKFLSCFDHE